MKIGFLIPCTSKNRSWSDFNDIYLHIFTLKSFLQTQDEEHTYTFYIGIDHDDPIFTNPYIIPQFKKFLRSYKHINITFTYFDDIPKGHLTKMWNILYKEAHEDKCDYFFQCGDDINFRTEHWVTSCIEVLTEPQVFQDQSDPSLRFFQLRIKVNANAPLGPRSVTILNPNGSSKSRDDAFTVLASSGAATGSASTVRNQEVLLPSCKGIRNSPDELKAWPGRRTSGRQNRSKIRVNNRRSILSRTCPPYMYSPTQSLIARKGAAC
mgnify:CR=1 FL=1